MFAPPPCQSAPSKTRMLPRGIAAAMLLWSRGLAMAAARLSAGVAGQRWLPGTRRVAPFSSVKSPMAHIVLQTSDGCGRGRAVYMSSVCSGWAPSPGLMVRVDATCSRQSGPSTASASASTGG